MTSVPPPAPGAQPGAQPEAQRRTLPQFTWSHDAAASPPPAPPPACLVVVHAEQPRQVRRRHPVAGELALGRRLDGTVAVASTAASHPVRIVSRGADHVLVDLQATGATLVNDARVRERALRSGDRIQLGSTLLLYLAAADADALDDLYFDEVARLAIVDGLTGLYNRRAVVAFLERELVRHRDHGQPLSLVMLDVDGLARVNHRFGWLAGDLTLRAVARTLRPPDPRDELLGRCDAGRFVLVLPHRPIEAAVDAAEQAREAVETLHVPWADGHVPVRVSGSAVAADPTTGRAEELLGKARAVLADAKRDGGNRIAWAG